jgi:hypothetical protein
MGLLRLGEILIVDYCNYLLKKKFLDVPTRSNNTYMMVTTAVEFKQVFLKYLNRDQNFL